jgi:hypothetical protein
LEKGGPLSQEAPGSCLGELCGGRVLKAFVFRFFGREISEVKEQLNAVVATDEMVAEAPFFHFRKSATLIGNQGFKPWMGAVSRIRFLGSWDGWPHRSSGL